MKCSTCGGHYFFTNRCPLCGGSTQVPQNRMAKLLLFPLEIGPVMLNVYYLYVLLALNLSVLCILVNLITYRLGPVPVVWSQYVAGGLLAVGLLLKIPFSERRRALVSVRRALYVGLAAGAVTQIVLWQAQNFVFLSTVLPVVLIVFDVFCVACFLLKCATSFSFFVTLLLNTVVSLIPFILMHRLPFSAASVILIDLSFGISVLAVANLALLKLLAMLYRAKGGNWRS